MGKRTRIGTCHLCGAHGALSFEHVPPRAAFNDRPIVEAGIDQLLRDDDDPKRLDNIRGRPSQRGAGAFTLCAKCNNDTGAWYGPAYVDWAFQGLWLAEHAQVAPSLVFTFHVFPLRVMKEIICMFFSANGAGFRERHPELVRFVLNKETIHIDPSVRIWTYFNSSARSRQTGIIGAMSLGAGTRPAVFSEISFPPWGYVMTLDGAEPPDERLVDVSHFARFSYNDWKHIDLRIPVLPVYSWLPGDYRSREEVIAQTGRNMERRRREGI